MKFLHLCPLVYIFAENIHLHFRCDFVLDIFILPSEIYGSVAARKMSYIEIRKLRGKIWPMQLNKKKKKTKSLLTTVQLMSLWSVVLSLHSWQSIIISNPVVDVFCKHGMCLRQYYEKYNYTYCIYNRDKNMKTKNSLVSVWCVI